MGKRRVLLTGAAGHIGAAYLRHASERYDFRLTDRRPIEFAEDHEVVICDLADPDSARKVCDGIDTVVHLAADPRTSAEFYHDLLDPNFKAVYNIFRSAADAGCSRVIFASSVNAIFGYPQDRQVRESDAPRPSNVYGASKAFGESLGAYFAYGEGLSTVCIRIGGVGYLENVRPETPAYVRSFFISYRDLCHLLDRCIETPDIPYAIAHGISNNERSLLDLTETRARFDYQPVDDAFHPDKAADV